jgi:hypothetical protein
VKTLRGGGPTIQWLESEGPEAEVETPGMPDGQRRMKSLTIDLPAGLYRRFKLACMDRTMAEEVLALIERRTEEMEREEEGRGPR